jgi:phosphoribosylaminoimidazolecarboxamide formyltransferase/IMP cyclohydrolase
MSLCVPIRRALISVSDKRDLIPFARALAARGVTILSTGGTFRALSEAGIAVVSVEGVTGFPEGLDGRVKTLHPAVHAGILAVRDNPEHAAFLKRHGIEPIDLVCINLYPFQETVADPDVSLVDAIENIDVGGPAMIRAAAKNHAFVTVVVSPASYDRVINEMDAGGNGVSAALRAELAAVAFARTGEYDTAIASFLQTRTGSSSAAGRLTNSAVSAAFPPALELRYAKVDQLRYGENPHQEAALYHDPAFVGQSVVSAKQLHGKGLSYNNINDAASALEAAKALGRLSPSTGGGSFLPPAGAVVVKHTNPCGGAVGPDLTSAVEAALLGDPVAAYGGILAVSRRIDLATARIIADPSRFLEVIIAPDFDADALDLLKSRWTQVRLLAVGEKGDATAGSSGGGRRLEYRSVPGGMLVQDRDTRASDPSLWEHKAGPKPTLDVLAAAAALETLCRFVTSNAVVVGGIDPQRPGCTRLLGVGSGQVDRVSACRLAVGKAGPLARGSIAVGDAFFPFADGPKVLIDAGVTTIVHPGGSKRDQETFELCDKAGVTCLITGVRHFRH